MQWSLSPRMALAWRFAVAKALAFPLAGALGAGLGLSGCASNDYPLAPATAAASAKASGQGTYRIGPLDALQVKVWQQPDLSAKVTVRPDGRLSLPLVQDLQAAGRTPSELARDIEQALSKYVREPSVSVLMDNPPAAVGAQVRVVGEALAPRSVPCRDKMTVLDVMIQVGGLTPYADGNAAVLVRGEGGPGVRYRLRLKDLLKRGDISANVEVVPGDIIIVPQAVF